MRWLGGRPTSLDISGEGDSNNVFVEVQDTGPGLASADLDRLFRSFYTTKPDGMGMGLAISRSIAEAHGGRLSAAPNKPRGAVFRSTLPLEETLGAPGNDGAAGQHRHGADIVDQEDFPKVYKRYT